MNDGQKITPPAKATLFTPRLLSWFVTLLIPFVLTLSSVRMIMFPAFLEFEYRTPAFPKDYYGFTLDDRLYWSKIALEYLLNNQGIDFLSSLRFADGSPVYNQRELRHMVDVKVAVQNMLWVWRISLVIWLLLGIWAWRGHWGYDFRVGLRRGGWLTMILVGVIVLFASFAFGIFFVAFHNVFFDPGTWMFDWKDTLIRLFPERFWRDVFLYVGGMSLLGGLILGLVLREKKKV